MAKSHISELLPTKYRKRHQLMLYLYDILVDMLVKADKYQLSNLSFRFTKEINGEIDLFDELDRQKDLDISEYVYIPHIFFSILRDLNYYLFESLSCIAVSYTHLDVYKRQGPCRYLIYYLETTILHASK